MKRSTFFIVFLLLATSGWAQVSVRGYYRANGTYVQPHHRSNPDGDVRNNYSYQGNVNPYTGEIGTKRDKSGSSNRNYQETSSSHSATSGQRDYSTSSQEVSPLVFTEPIANQNPAITGPQGPVLPTGAWAKPVVEKITTYEGPAPFKSPGVNPVEVSKSAYTKNPFARFKQAKNTARLSEAELDRRAFDMFAASQQKKDKAWAADPANQLKMAVRPELKSSDRKSRPANHKGSLR